MKQGQLFKMTIFFGTLALVFWTALGLSGQAYWMIPALGMTALQFGSMVLYHKNEE